MTALQLLTLVCEQHNYDTASGETEGVRLGQPGAEGAGSLLRPSAAAEVWHTGARTPTGLRF